MATPSSRTLSIDAYRNSDFTDHLDNFFLQLNPAELSFSVGQNKSASQEEDKGVDGSILKSISPSWIQQSLKLSFTIDDTGVVPNPIERGSIVESIEKLKNITVVPDPEIHRPPFVKVSWGDGVSIKGTVSSFDYVYTFFDFSGAPLRANVTMNIVEYSDNQRLFQSPDITKMPIVKGGDTIVKLSEKYYNDKKYYLQLAEFNNLSSLRNLKLGVQIEIPPIK
jgi:nucleoid-associated protein YgaU|tara:strand:- start:7655 stop:8323 length:669 start_codon:yes stop_codon:yes gene_type:complete